MSALGLDDNYSPTFKKNEVESQIFEFFDSNKNDENICLKVFDKNSNDADYFLSLIKNEGKILSEFNSNYIIKLNNIIDNDKCYILELEYYNGNLGDNIHITYEKGNKEIFKKIIISLVEALKELKSKGVIHRNIKPESIYMFETDEDSDNFDIKLANFDCAIYSSQVSSSTQMGSFMYSAPEIIKNLKYDEKSDLWSLGVTLFKLYFGVFPFGQYASINKVKKIIEGKEDFIYRKSGIPSLNILFKRLLCINPEERMSLEELIDFVKSKNFLKENENFIHEKNSKYNYEQLYEEIKLEEQIEYKNQGHESFDKSVKDKVEKILNYFKEIDYSSDINTNDITFIEKDEFNNIIYYDDNTEKKYEETFYNNYIKFQQYTNGAFIFCKSKEELELIKSEIKEKYAENENYKFNLITSGSSWINVFDNMMKNDNDFKKIIKNVCIFCKDIKKYKDLQYNGKKINDVWDNPELITNFIKRSSSVNIHPFPAVKLITLESYQKDYKLLHRIISAFYGVEKSEIFEESLKEVKELIKNEDREKKLQTKLKSINEAFEKFDVNNELNNIELIIKEYTKNTCYKDFNAWQMSLNEKYFFPNAYFVSRLIYCLNQYGNEKSKNKDRINYINKNEKIYRGTTLTFIDLINYKRAEKKVIMFPSFSSASLSDKQADRFAKRGRPRRRENSQNGLFSVIFYISNIYNKGWISNGVDVSYISCFEEEEEVIYQAFSFFYVQEVEINFEKEEANIYLETIGKKSILEEAIKKGMDIEYNKNEKIMQIKK